MRGFFLLLSFLMTIVLGLVVVDRLLGPAPTAKAAAEANPIQIVEISAAPDTTEMALAPSLPVTAPIFGVPINYNRTFTRNGVPVDGDICQFRFSLWDSMTDGQGQGKPYTTKRLRIQNGELSISLSFGDAYSVGAHWLQVEARCNKERDYSVFGPRYLVKPEEYGMVAVPSQYIVCSFISTDSQYIVCKRKQDEVDNTFS